ncbi:MAG: trehalose-6-phosphate synthase [Endomicrobiales bacterium]
MKRLLLFTLPLLVIVTIVFAISGILQVRYQEERLIDDLQRKAKNVAESMELSARQILLHNDTRTAQRLADKFQTRERLQGCVFYTREGKVLAITERIAEWSREDKVFLGAVLAGKTPRDRSGKYGDYSLYSYILPITDDDGTVLGMVEVAYDTSYVYKTLTELWRRMSLTLLVLLVLMVGIVLLLQRQIFFLPLQRLTDWFQRFQKGETDEQLSFKGIGDLGTLAREVEQVALGLRVARKTVSQEAQERISKDDSWTEDKLKDLVRARLGENSLFVVSNREPFMHVMDETPGTYKCIRPASGVVTALDPVMRACGGHWIAHAGGNADRKFVNSKGKLGVPPDDMHYILKRVWLSKAEEAGYYYGFSNEGLWPLCHITHTRPVFSEPDWQMYKKVNRKFADALLEELPAKNPFVFIQDYHFTLLAKMIKEKRPDATIALFWHIPWPNPEVFSICPYQEEILDGMLGCDLIGFHVQYHCNNFLDTANRLLESRVDAEKFSVVRANKETFIRSYPISVSDAPGGDISADIQRIRAEFGLEDKIIALSVERIDYTKGIAERVQAVDRFFEKYPDFRGKVVFIQIAAPSRTHIKRYHDLMGEIDEQIEKVNWKYSDGTWKPFLYLKRHFSIDEIKPYYELADLCIVSSLHDGMNLVAKEYIVSRSDLKGMLVLSRFTGAARELSEAVQINPYSTEEFADAIKGAIEMPLEEKVRRMAKMRKTVSGNNVYRWAAAIVNDLTTLKKGTA